MRSFKQLFILFIVYVFLKEEKQFSGKSPTKTANNTKSPNIFGADQFKLQEKPPEICARIFVRRIYLFTFIEILNPSTFLRISYNCMNYAIFHKKKYKILQLNHPN